MMRQKYDFETISYWGKLDYLIFVDPYTNRECKVLDCVRTCGDIRLILRQRIDDLSDFVDKPTLGLDKPNKLYCTLLFK